MFRWQARSANLILATILLGSASLALVWVFRVPIYQSPDEPQHLDYALCLSEHPGLFRARDMPPVERPNYCVHPYTFYLIDRAATGAIAFHPDARVPADYGTRTYFDALDQDAPPRETIHIETPPALLACYPFGYYLLLAGWIELLRLCGGGLVVQFFGARCLSVLLLVCSLLLTHAAARELRLKRSLALLLTAGIGFLPLTSFISSYVQPDNLSFTLVSLCFYLSLRARRQPESLVVAALLGTALGALLVTKAHYYLCVLVAVLAMLIVESLSAPVSWRRRAGLAGVVLLPSLVLGSIHLWSVWGATNYFGPAADDPEFPLGYLQRFKRAFLDFYARDSHTSFWGVFGWLDAPLVIGGKRLSAVVFIGIKVCGWILLGLTLFRLEQVISRLFRLSRKGRRRLALRLAVSNPLINSYFVFTIMMFYLHIRLDNRFGAQGRNWLPFMLPIFLTGIVYAPKALTIPQVRRGFTALLAGALILFALVGSYYGLKTINKRYYQPPRSRMASVANSNCRLRPGSTIRIAGSALKEAAGASFTRAVCLLVERPRHEDNLEGHAGIGIVSPGPGAYAPRSRSGTAMPVVNHAVIWDMDGTLVDTAELHFQAWATLARELGQPFTRADFAGTFGWRNAEIIPRIFRPRYTPEEVSQLGERKEEFYRAAARHGVTLLPGVRTLLEDLHAAGFRQAIGSSAPRPNLDLILDLTGTAALFAAVVSMENTQKGKPDPEVFLLAAARMGIAPAHCLVMEDAPVGVQAARAGGMKCIGINFIGHHSVAALQAAGADRVVKSLEEIAVADVVKLLC